MLSSFATLFNSLAYYVGRLREKEAVGSPIAVFHSAMIVMSALQIYQTKEALVTQPGADCATNYAVSHPSFAFYGPDGTPL